MNITVFYGIVCGGIILDYMYCGIKPIVEFRESMLSKNVYSPN